MLPEIENKGMFCSPAEAYGADSLDAAYWTVMRELQGEGLSEELITAAQPGFIDELGDPRKAGRLLADAFSEIDWDWPRWYPFAKRQGHATVKEVRQIKPTLPELFGLSLKAELLALAASLGRVLPKALGKREIIKQLMLLPARGFESWAEAARRNLLEAQLVKVRREMGQFVAGRICALAGMSRQYKVLQDSEVLALCPNWKFHCPSDLFPPVPKKCRDLNDKILPAKEAMKKFPTLPCERLDCHCDIYTRNSRGE